MKKGITAEIVNLEALEYASQEFTKLLFEFYIQEKEIKVKEDSIPESINQRD